MASEMVDLIDCPLTLTLIGSTPWTPRGQYKSVQHVPGVDLATLSIRGNLLSNAVTQGVSFS